MRSLNLTLLFVCFFIAVNAQNTQEKDKNDLAKDKMRNYAQVADAAFFEANHKNNELSPFIDVDIHEFIVMKVSEFRTQETAIAGWLF